MAWLSDRRSRVKPCVLLVEPDWRFLLRLNEVIRHEVRVSGAVRSFVEARRRLQRDPWDLLVTNLRLGLYNGLHLVHLTATQSTRCLVYAPVDHVDLARDVLAAGAFYERQDDLHLVLRAYLRAVLPPHDRRNVACRERRQTFRGGRRASDRAFNE